MHVPGRNCSLNAIASYINRRIKTWSEFHTLWDFRDYNFETLDYRSVSGFVRMIEEAAEVRSNLKSAILVQSTLAHGFSEMFKTLATGRDIKVELHIFTEKQEALDWLNS